MLSGQIEICDYDYWIDGIFVILGKLSILENLMFWEKKCKKGVLVILTKKGIFVILHLGLVSYFGKRAF